MIATWNGRTVPLARESEVIGKARNVLPSTATLTACAEPCRSSTLAGQGTQPYSQWGRSTRIPRASVDATKRAPAWLASEAWSSTRRPDALTIALVGTRNVVPGAIVSASDWEG